MERINAKYGQKFRKKRCSSPHSLSDSIRSDHSLEQNHRTGGSSSRTSELDGELSESDDGPDRCRNNETVRIFVHLLVTRAEGRLGGGTAAVVAGGEPGRCH